MNHQLPTVPLTRFDSPVSAAFEVDEERRTIRGLAVPYGVPAESGGKRWQFSKGTLSYTEPSRVKVLIGHDFDRAVGVSTSFNDTDDGLFITARIAKGAAGDEALSMAAEGVWDGLSIGLGNGGRFRLRDGVNHAVTVPLQEVSITPMPAFESARIQSVAASHDVTKENAMQENETVEVEAGNGPDFSQITDAIKAGFADLNAFGPREVVPATSTQFAVTEELPYRFDGVGGKFGFIEDMHAAQQGDSEARQRLAVFGEEFAQVMFAVTTGNVSTLNPTQNRPELYVPNLTYSRPLWESVSTGVVNDKTPFTVPKFSSATGLVGAHTEGTEPTPGAFTATSQTITPSALSGKVEINREVLDAGGSPQADSIIWGEMVNAYYEAIEARIATALAAVPTAELNLASATNATLVDALTNYYAGLQFVRGGNRFTGLALDGMLFPALVNAADTTGRKLLPVFGPNNAQGQVSGAFDRVQIGNQTGRAAWALGATNASKSYSFVPSSVWAWASAPKKFVFEYQVKSVDLAIWGYAATAVLRDSDVKPIDYTTADA